MGGSILVLSFILIPEGTIEKIVNILYEIPLNLYYTLRVISNYVSPLLILLTTIARINIKRLKTAVKKPHTAIILNSIIVFISICFMFIFMCCLIYSPHDPRIRLDPRYYSDDYEWHGDHFCPKVNFIDEINESDEILE